MGSIEKAIAEIKQLKDENVSLKKQLEELKDENEKLKETLTQTEIELREVSLGLD